MKVFFHCAPANTYVIKAKGPVFDYVSHTPVRFFFASDKDPLWGF